MSQLKSFRNIFLVQRKERDTLSNTSLFASCSGHSDNSVFLQIVTSRIRQGQIFDFQLKLNSLKIKKLNANLSSHSCVPLNVAYICPGLIRGQCEQLQQDTVSYLAQFLTHLVGLGHHGHQLNVVVEDR